MLPCCSGQGLDKTIGKYIIWVFCFFYGAVLPASLTTIETHNKSLWPENRMYERTRTWSNSWTQSVYVEHDSGKARLRLEPSQRVIAMCVVCCVCSDKTRHDEAVHQHQHALPRTERMSLALHTLFLAAVRVVGLHVTALQEEDKPQGEGRSGCKQAEEEVSFRVNATLYSCGQE